MRTNLMTVTLLLFAQLCTAQTPDSTTKGFLHFTIGAPLSQYEQEVTPMRTNAPEIRPRYFSYNKYKKQKVAGVPFRFLHVSFDSLDLVNDIMLTNHYGEHPNLSPFRRAKKHFAMLLDSLTAAWNRPGEYRILYDTEYSKTEEYRWQNATAAVLLQLHQDKFRKGKSITVYIMNINYVLADKSISPPQKAP